MTPIWPFRHFGLKVWSVVLAVALWLAVTGDESVERGLRVPLELQQFPAGLELQGDAPALVDVRVRGESSALGRVGAGDIVAVLDLKTARPGRRLFQLTPEQVRVPFGVEVVQVTPSSVALAFENSATRQLPVVPAIEGVPAAGFVVGKPVSNPATVEVVGPESAVVRATEALTEPISVAGAKQDITETVNVGFQDAALRLKTPRPSIVTVPILPGPLERTLLDQPVHLRSLEPNLVATRRTVGHQHHPARQQGRPRARQSREHHGLRRPCRSGRGRVHARRSGRRLSRCRRRAHYSRHRAGDHLPCQAVTTTLRAMR